MAPSERSASWVLLEVLIVLMLLIRLEDGSCLLTLACVSVRWRARRGQQFPQTVPLWTEAQHDIAFISPGEIMSVRFAAIAGTISFGGECKWARGTSRRRRFRLKDRKSVGVITGVRGGYDIDVRRFHAKGMVLLGHLRGIEHDTLTFASDLEETLAHADDACRHLLISVDDYIRQNGLSASEPSVPEERPPVPPLAPDTEPVCDGHFFRCLGHRLSKRLWLGPATSVRPRRPAHSIGAASPLTLDSTSSASGGCIPSGRHSSRVPIRTRPTSPSISLRGVELLKRFKMFRMWAGTCRIGGTRSGRYTVTRQCLRRQPSG